MGEPTDASFSEYPNVIVITVRERAMIKMLIFNAMLLLLGFSPTSHAAMKTRLKRELLAPTGSIIWSTESADSRQKHRVIPHSVPPTGSSDILHALGTTIHTLPSIDPTSGLHHTGKTIQSNFPSNFGHPQSQPAPNRPPPNNYNPSPYSPQVNNQFRNKLAALPAGSEKSQYFADPSSYRILSEAAKNQQPRSSQFPVSASLGSYSSSFPKFSSLALSQSITSDGFKSPSKYRFTSGNSRPTGYKTGSRSLASNNIKISSPSLQSAKNQPVFESTGSDNRAHSEPVSAHNYPNSKSHSSPTSGTFSPYASSGKTRNHQARILPIKSTASTPEIPRYQAASIDDTALNRYEKPFEGYQQLANQPQFHFTRGTTVATPTSQSDEEQPPPTIVYHDNPFQQIRTDVELINKKRTTTPDPFDSEENDFGQVFSTASHNFGQSSARDENFELPSSNLFDSYDQAFGKYSKLASLEQKKNKAKRPSSTKHDETTKPVHQSIEEEDDEDDGDAPAAGKDDEDKSSSGEYRSSYTDGKDSSGSYEEEDGEEGEGEEESQRNERQGSYEGKDESDDEDDEDNDDRKKAPFRSYADDFEHEFEESYRKDLPKSDYVHVKEVPEVEEPRRSETRKHSDKRPRTKTVRSSAQRQQTSNRHAPTVGKEAPRTPEETRQPRDYATTTAIPSVEQLQSYTFRPFANNDWRPSEKVADRDIYGETRQEIRAIFSPKKSTDFLSEAHHRRHRHPHAGLTYSTKGHNFRDLTGI